MIRFGPIYVTALWGGRRLASQFLRADVPAGPIGESWELSDLADSPTSATSDPYRGRRLGDLWRAGALGGSSQGAFPFLLKWIDAASQLSVQVHPDAQSCRELGFGQPKTEAWRVVAAEPGAQLLVGHRTGLDATELRRAAADGSLPQWLHALEPSPGDMVLLPAGTLHAIGAGLLVLEVQQPSATTFRLYDWGRLQADGRPRALHLEEGARAVAYQRPGEPRLTRTGVEGPGFAMQSLEVGVSIHAGPLRVFVAADGAARLQTARGDVALAWGEVIVAEPSDGAITTRGHAVVLVSEALLPAIVANAF